MQLVEGIDVAIIGIKGKAFRAGIDVGKVDRIYFYVKFMDEVFQNAHIIECRIAQYPRNSVRKWKY